MIDAGSSDCTPPGGPCAGEDKLTQLGRSTLVTALRQSESLLRFLLFHQFSKKLWPGLPVPRLEFGWLTSLGGGIA